MDNSLKGMSQFLYPMHTLLRDDDVNYQTCSVTIVSCTGSKETCISSHLLPSDSKALLMQANGLLFLYVCCN